MNRLPLLLVLAIAGCCPAGASKSSTPDPGPAGVKLQAPVETEVKPLETRAAAKKQDQALILGTANGAVVIPLAGRENAVEVHPMSFLAPQGGQPASGLMRPVVLTTAPTGDNHVRVGVYEQFAGGIGSQTRAATWIAAFLAATTIGKDLTDFRFSSESEGFRDGPSAGGLMTAGFLASILGTPIDPTVTMTGIVNPDGTIGPVGGIPHKFEAAAKGGKKRLGYPVGQRYDIDFNTKRPVDLQEVARQNGAEAVEVADLYEAYTLLTGQTLPRPVPLDEREMEIGGETEKRLAAMYDGWLGLYRMHEDKLLVLARAGNLPAPLLKLGVIAQEERVTAERLRQQGLSSAAYQRIVRATVYAASATSVMDIVAYVQKGDAEGAWKRLMKEINVQDRTIRSLKTIGQRTPQTIAEYLLQLSAFQPAIAGWGQEQWGMARLREAAEFLESLEKMPPEQLASTETRDKVVDAITVPILYLTRGEAYARVSLETLEIESAEGLAFQPTAEGAKRLALSFSSAAAANLAYFESIIVEPAAADWGIAREQAEERVYKIEPRYLVAKWAFMLPGAAAQHFGWGEGSLPATMAALGGSILSYYSSATIIAEWYSLGVTDGPRGDSMVTQEKAFINMLTQAERKAREHAHAAKVAIGQVPVQARIHYQNARVLREGTTRDKLRALEEFWAASTYSQVAVMLARN